MNDGSGIFMAASVNKLRPIPKRGNSGIGYGEKNSLS